MSLFASSSLSEESPLVVVAVERAVDRSPDGLTYALPPKLAQLPEGARVEVPLGRGETPTAGWIVRRLAAEEDPGIPRGKIKAVLAQDASGAVLPGELIQFARWISAYYACPIGMTLAAILPAAVRKSIGRVERTLVALAAESRTHLAMAQAFREAAALRAEADAATITAAIAALDTAAATIA
ncbi:MAG: hypothetical protein ACO3QC_13610, partial [Phycisphaerales bacterium]